jgi:triosephosphate isomerase
MNPRSRDEAKKLFQTITRKKITAKNVTVVVCPPFLYISELAKGYKGTKIFFGAQDVSFEKEGAFTGEVSVAQLQDSKVRFSIIGHSERRAMGETNELVSKKVKFALASGMHAVLCVGETTRDEEGTHLKFIEEQLKESLAGISKKMISRLVVAYEPVWAIGKGHSAMMPEDISRMTLFIRKILVDIYGRNVAQEMSVIYGGSADADNAQDIVANGHVDGLLVGRQSLNADAFVGTINSISNK